MSFIHDDFLLRGDAARRLYHEYAAAEPILDYHNHLPPADIAADRQFGDLYEIWLAGDHYKWRAMRCNGEAERCCTGDATPREKYDAWVRTVPQTLRNPLYHWTHLELKRYFGIEDLLDETTADGVWEVAGEQLARPEMSARNLLRKFGVRALCTTDDPTDSLAHHAAIRASGFEVRVYPTFRPDKAYAVDDPVAFRAWTERLELVSGIGIASFADFLAAIRQRHDAFHALGGRLSDHGMNRCFADFPSESEAARIFDAARAGGAATPEEQEQFASYLMLYFGQLDSEKGWTKQLHLGGDAEQQPEIVQADRADIGCDSIGDYRQAEALSAYLSRLGEEGALPKVVLYNNNPNDNYIFASLAGNFMDGEMPGKIQFGSGWWFADQKEGMEWQMNALSNLGLFSRFIGMLTDSRSFMSFPRHEYFRRTLCNLLGQDMDDGLVPGDYEMVGEMVRNICYRNAREFLGLEVAEEGAGPAA